MSLTVLYDDGALFACVKPAGILSESPGMPERILAETGAAAHPAHRLDRDTAGVMLFARSAAAAARLGEIIRSGGAVKEYLAVVRGETAPAGEWRDLLYHDPRASKTYVVDRMRRGVREAALSFTRLAAADRDAGTFSLVRVRLHTGRTHQIRAQFAARRYPVAGDARYGGGKGAMALFSASITLPYPGAGDRLCLTARPEYAGFWAMFPEELYAAAMSAEPKGE